MKLLRHLYLQTCTHAIMNVHIYTESYKNPQRSQCMCSSWGLKFCGQRSALSSTEPVPSSLSECGHMAVGPKRWSHGIKLVISKMFVGSHRMTIYLANMTALTWKVRVLFVNIPSDFKFVLCMCVHIPYSHTYGNCKWSLND